MSERRRIAFEENRRRLSITSPEAGKASVEVECDYEGEPVEIGFNAAYLLEAIDTACPTLKPFHMALISPGTPAIFRGNSTRFTDVLMPMWV